MVHGETGWQWDKTQDIGREELYMPIVILLFTPNAQKLGMIWGNEHQANQLWNRFFHEALCLVPNYKLC